MELVIDKFTRRCDPNDLLDLKDNRLEDVVYSYRFLFKHDDIDTSKFKFITLTFHYLIDKCESDINLTFDILSPNRETGNNFFINYKEERIRTKNTTHVTLENQYPIKLKKETIKFNNNNLSFTESHELILSHIENDLYEFKDFLQKNNINYNQKELTKFNNELISYFGKSMKSHLSHYSNEINTLDSYILASNLESELSDNSTLTSKKKKLKI